MAANRLISALIEQEIVADTGCGTSVGSLVGPA